jgi:hypothetical protein
MLCSSIKNQTARSTISAMQTRGVYHCIYHPVTLRAYEVILRDDPKFIKAYHEGKFPFDK